MAFSREQKIEELRQMLAKYIASGKRVEDIRVPDPEYVAVANAYLFAEDGKKLSVEEKFSLLGFPRKRVRNMKMTDEEWADKAKTLIKQYKDAGGKVDDLNKRHKIYEFISSRDLIVDGKRLNLEEKFTYLGEPRARKKTDNIEKALREDIERYLASGGSFHVRRKMLPFYERLHNYVDKGNFSSYEEAMKSLGYKNYSDTYYRFLDLQNISKFCDENGFFVYKREMDNSNFHNILQAAADTLQMPAPLIVMLLCDKKMQHCVVETDYVEYLKSQLEEYARNNNDSFVGIRRKAPKLYNKLRHFKTYAYNTEDELSTEIALAFMGLDDCKFRHYKTNVDCNITKELTDIREKNLGKVVTISDFPGGLRKKVYMNACRQGIQVSDYLAQYGIEYKGFDANERFRRVKMDTYPYIDEMKERRDELIAEMSEGKDLCKEEVFEVRVLACKQAYEEYKERINNFTGEKVDVSGKNMSD